jgi:glycosyltransferase involved in cell wall biosynthesis
MNLLFLSYWSIQEGLTKSTVIPNVQILAGFDQVDRIMLVTLERGKNPGQSVIHPKITHYPIRAGSLAVPLLDKIIDFYRIPRILSHLAGQFKIQKMIARGSPAGALAYLTWKRNGISFYVESFEPHADYMLESLVWKKWGLRYLFQKVWELKIKNQSAGLITVSQNYKTQLIKEGFVNIPVQVAPCGVNTDKFRYHPKDRISIRNQYHISSRTVTGIYVGKFGDIYYDLEAFELFKITFDFFKGEFFLIILTPDSYQKTKNKLKDAGFPLQNLIIQKVEHAKVPQYLSAADFGYATIRKSPSKIFCSPVKTGEYWANGLPVLLTEGVGDECNYLESFRGGALLNINDPIPALEKMKSLLLDPDLRNYIPELAKKYRSFDQVTHAYRKILFP